MRFLEAEMALSALRCCCCCVCCCVLATGVATTTGVATGTSSTTLTGPVDVAKVLLFQSDREFPTPKTQKEKEKEKDDEMRRTWSEEGGWCV